ncbi:MAG: hypothetical protein ACTHWQ_09725, partial [Sphingobacterium sp.]
VEKDFRADGPNFGPLTSSLIDNASLRSFLKISGAFFLNSRIVIHHQSLKVARGSRATKTAEIQLFLKKRVHNSQPITRFKTIHANKLIQNQGYMIG